MKRFNQPEMGWGMFAAVMTVIFVVDVIMLKAGFNFLLRFPVALFIVWLAFMLRNKIEKW